MLVKDFLRKYSEDSFELMTQKGYIVLPSHQAQDLLDNTLIAQKSPKNLVGTTAITAEDLLEQQVVNARWEKGVCYVMTCTSGTSHNSQEVYGMKEMGVEGAFTEYAPYLLQMENPFETLKSRWLSEQGDGCHEELDHLLWRMTFQEQNMDVKSEESGASDILGQRLTVC